MGSNWPRRFDVVSRAITRRRALVSMAGAAVGLAGAQKLTGAQSPVASPVAEDGLVVRRDASTLTPEERTAYVDAILALKVKPSPWIDGLSTYDTFVSWHRDAFVCGVDAAHMGPAFFPWHRVYLNLFQQQINEIDPSVVLPYWNWLVDTSPDSYLWQDDFMGGNGVKDQGEAVLTGPFRKDKWVIEIFDYSDTYQFPWLIRDFGAGSLAPELPTPEQVEQALAIETYDAAPWNATTPAEGSFRNFIEGWRDCGEQICDPVAGVSPMCTGSHDLHNRVHLWVAGEVAFAHELTMDEHEAGPATPTAAPVYLGTMAANSSPNDPVFFLHHVNMDRLWSQWLARHGQVYLPESGGPYGHNLNDFMWPYQGIGLEVSPAMMLDSRKWGYVYDTELS